MPVTTLTTDHTEILCRILRACLHDLSLSVFVFGSRTSLSHRRESDVDLLLDTAAAIPLSTLSRLKEAFEESNLPFRVDVVLRTDISPEFYQRISQDCMLLCACGDATQQVQADAIASR